MSMHICLVTPGHLSTNPRLVKEADALAAAGYRVSVVSSRHFRPADEADREFESRPWARYMTAYGPLAGRWRHLAGSADRRVSQMIYRLTGLCADRAYHPVTPSLTREVCSIRADLYIAHNLAALPAAYAAAKQRGAKLGFDAEDFHRGELSAAPGHALALRLTREIENTYIPRCDYLTAASPGIARAYALACDIKQPTVILNVFPKSDAPTSFTDKGEASPCPSLYWFSQTIGANRGLEAVIEAIGKSRTRPMLYLRGTPALGYLDSLNALAQRHDVTDCLHILPPAAPSDMARLAAQYSIGIASEPGHTQNNRIALSNKLFTFLLAGVPILASATTAQADIASAMPGALFLYPQHDAQALARHIDDLCQSPERLARARQAAWQLGQTRFNWDMESARFLEVVQRCLDCMSEKAPT